MGVTDDHIHEIEVVVHGAQVVHRHGFTFIGVPGDVEIRHRATPLVVGPHHDTDGPPPGWEECELGEWYEQDEPWDDTPVRHDA